MTTIAYTSLFRDSSRHVRFNLRVLTDLRLPKPRQLRSQAGLWRDYRASLING